MTAYKFLSGDPAEEPKPMEWQTSLYQILFGNQDLPITAEVTPSNDTMITILGAAALLAAGIVTMALILKK